jgi:hypothetical protein
MCRTRTVIWFWDERVPGSAESFSQPLIRNWKQDRRMGGLRRFEVIILPPLGCCIIATTQWSYAIRRHFIWIAALPLFFESE